MLFGIFQVVAIDEHTSFGCVSMQIHEERQALGSRGCGLCQDHQSRLRRGFFGIRRGPVDPVQIHAVTIMSIMPTMDAVRI